MDFHESGRKWTEAKLRKLVGGLVLVAGFGGLGYVGSTNHAERMEKQIDDLAGGIAGTAILPVEAVVSGRDVTVSGLAMDASALDALKAQYQGIEGVRVVNVDGVELLPVADPFEIQLTKDDSDAITATGYVPTYTAQAQIGDVASDLPLAAGAPDGWVSSVQLGQQGLAPLNSGQMTLSDTVLTLTGVANTPAELAAAEAAIGQLPDGFTSDVQIEVLDDGTPLRLDLTVADSAVTGTAKLPSELDGVAGFGSFDVTQSPLSAVDAQWPSAAVAVADASSSLIEGDVSLVGPTLTLRGQASPEDKAAAEAALATLPENYETDVQIDLWDDGEPLQVSMAWDGTAATANGKLPADFELSGPAGVAVDPTGTVSFRPDADGAFSANALAGVAALGALNEGTLIATADTILLSGVANSPQVEVAIDEALANAVADAQITKDFTYLDDGSPASWVLSYDATTGGALEGRLPTTLDADIFKRCGRAIWA